MRCRADRHSDSTPNDSWDRVNSLGRFTNQKLVTLPLQAALNTSRRHRERAVAAGDRPQARASQFGGREDWRSAHLGDSGKSGSGDRLGIYPLAGADGGGDDWTVIASLIECCKLNSVDPYAYLVDVLAKIVDGHLNSAIDDLLPWAYVASQPFKAVA